MVRLGFTLVELLIVAVVLAIFASIVATQLGGVDLEARESALKSTLSRARKAIDLYHTHHGGNYPGQAAALVGPGCTTSEQPAAAGTPTAFYQQMRFFTNAAGQFCPAQSAAFPYGPYMRWTSDTDNPVTGDETFVAISTGALVISATGPGGGFLYDTLSGKLIANDSNLDSTGLVRYDQY